MALAANLCHLPSNSFLRNTKGGAWGAPALRRCAGLSCRLRPPPPPALCLAPALQRTWSPVKFRGLRGTRVGKQAAEGGGAA